MAGRINNPGDTVAFPRRPATEQVPPFQHARPGHRRTRNSSRSRQRGAGLSTSSSSQSTLSGIISQYLSIRNISNHGFRTDAAYLNNPTDPVDTINQRTVRPERNIASLLWQFRLGQGTGFHE